MIVRRHLEDVLNVRVAGRSQLVCMFTEHRWLIIKQGEGWLLAGALLKVWMVP